MDYKAGDKVRVKDGGFTGYIVKIYYDQKVKSDMYVICSVALDAPALKGFKITSLADIPKFIEEIPSKIETKLTCQTYKFDSEDELEKI